MEIAQYTGDLSPGNPEHCRGNGTTVDESGRLLECCCDECDHLQECMKGEQSAWKY